MSLEHSPRKLVPIRKAPSYIGAKSPTTVYDLIKKDPEFAALWFDAGPDRTVAFEDRLTAYVEKRAETARKFVPVAEPKRKRGRPPKTRQLAATESR